MNKNPVIVIGMHRSGTSLVSRLLIELGLNMGRDLTKNYESAYFQNHNRNILSKIHSRWDNIEEALQKIKTKKDLEIDLPYDNALDNNQLYRRNNPPFYRLLNLGKTEEIFWGWKDPRNSLTLSFWLNYFPDAKIIYVVRNGIDAAISLHKRESEREKSHPDYSEVCQSFSNCFSLWTQYNEACINQKAKIKSNNFHSIKYERLLESPITEINDLSGFLLLNQSNKKINKTAQIINPKRLDNNMMRHIYSKEIEILQSNNALKMYGY